MGKANHLGDYLRARRAQVTPAEVGLVPGPRRRVTGLRRDELALLAGISSEYLQRLEQGRDRHPSTEVLESIARALRMDAKRPPTGISSLTRVPVHTANRTPSMCRPRSQNSSTSSPCRRSS
jgi:DNA-binding XRE family transcriptional regulator